MAEFGFGILTWCAFALFLAGIVKGILGIGVPVVSISLLSLVITIPVAVSLLPVPILLSNLWQSLTSGHVANTFRRFGPLIGAVVIGTFVGARLLLDLDQRALMGIVGAAVLVFAVSAHFPRYLRLGHRAERRLGVPIGFFAGVLGGMTTFFGPPLIMFLFALNLDKDEFVGVISTVYLCAAVPLAVALGMFGIMDQAGYLWSTAAAVPLLLGVLIGQWLRSRISQSAFRRGLLLLLLVVGVRLIYRAIVT
jgi:uncharacterized membrane protein YfcA